MKIHRHLVESMTLALKEIFEDGRHADKVIEKYLKTHRKWGSRDRKFFAEQVYDLVRWWRRDWYLLGYDPQFSTQKLMQLWVIHLKIKNEILPDGFDWGFDIRSVEVANSRWQELQKNRALRESIPDWMDQRGEKELGDRWDSIVKSLNLPAKVDLRVNTLKATVQAAQAELKKDEVHTEFIAGTESGLTLPERKNVFATEAFRKGFFEVQDRASQMVAPFVDVEPGHRVVDACAGAGGKSLHLAALMRNKGKILSLDIHEWKLKELKTRAARDGVDVIETRWIESNKVIKRLDKTADRVLLDVPCSGMGVLRRNPDSKWKLKSEEIDQITDLQKQILSEYSSMVKVGGKLVYATCSLMPSENERQVEWFLGQTSGWDLEEQMRIDPDQGRGDGFFAARLIRKS